MDRIWRPISIQDTPITITTFTTQGWEKNTETEDGEEFVYWSLPLPKDNPDGDSVCLVSSAEDDWEELGLSKGNYLVTLYDYNGLGECETEEEIEILYRALTSQDIYEDTNYNLYPDQE